MGAASSTEQRVKPRKRKAPNSKATGLTGKTELKESTRLKVEKTLLQHKYGGGTAPSYAPDIKSVPPPPIQGAVDGIVQVEGVPPPQPSVAMRTVSALPPIRPIESKRPIPTPTVKPRVPTPGVSTVRTSSPPIQTDTVAVRAAFATNLVMPLNSKLELGNAFSRELFVSTSGLVAVSDAALGFLSRGHVFDNPAESTHLVITTSNCSDTRTDSKKAEPYFAIAEDTDRFHKKRPKMGRDVSFILRKKTNRLVIVDVDELANWMSDTGDYALHIVQVARANPLPPCSAITIGDGLALIRIEKGTYDLVKRSILQKSHSKSMAITLESRVQEPSK
jgi:hypothetical protein